MVETVVELIQEGKDITTELTDTEQVRLQECEQVIKKGFNTFIEVGEALAEIRDNRLYRETHKEFKKYFKDVWDLSESYAYRQIDGAQTVKFLKTKTRQLASFPKENLPLPINEAQTRPLTRLKPDDQVKAWGVVVDILIDGPPGGKLTAALINKVVKGVRGDVVKRKIDKTKKQVENTQLVSTLFKKQYNVMMDIVSEERNSGWKTTSKKEAIKWVKTLVKVIEEMD
ncbi:MAG: hypothetical protein KAR45_05030 [Desulfobacteraceae bacterium]|nr:hypothetical protein [Desulfobacteraceae bacterium]